MNNILERTYIKPKEAASFLGYSLQYLYKLVEARKITAYRPTGRYLFFKQKDLEEFIERGKLPSDHELRNKADCILNKAI